MLRREEQEEVVLPHKCKCQQPQNADPSWTYSCAFCRDMMNILVIYSCQIVLLSPINREWGRSRSKWTGGFENAKE